MTKGASLSMKDKDNTSFIPSSCNGYRSDPCVYQTFLVRFALCTLWRQTQYGDFFSLYVGILRHFYLFHSQKQAYLGWIGGFKKNNKACTYVSPLD